MSPSSTLINIVKCDKANWSTDFPLFYSSFFITPQWVESAANDNCDPIYLDFVREGKVVAKISGLIVKGGLLKGTRLYFYSGPAFIEFTSDLLRDCLSELLAFAKRERYSKISVRPFDEVVHESVVVPGYKILKSHEYKILFYPDKEHKEYSYGFKQNVKKAKKAGAQLHMGRSQELLDVLFELIGNTQKMRTGKYGTEYNPLGLLNLNEATLRKLLDTGLGKFYYVTVDDNIVSIQLNLELGNRTYGFLMGSDNSAYKAGIPSFLDTNVIQFAQENGMSFYNLGGSPAAEQGGAGISKYKESMGGAMFDVCGYYSPFLGPRAWVLMPVLWGLNQIKSLNLIKKLQLLASKKGWLE